MPREKHLLGQSSRVKESRLFELGNRRGKNRASIVQFANYHSSPYQGHPGRTHRNMQCHTGHDRITDRNPYPAKLRTYSGLCMLIRKHPSAIA